MGEPVSDSSTGCEIAVWVVPGASRNEIVGLHGDRLKVRVAAPAEGGRANRHVKGLIEDRLGVSVDLTRGTASRAKVFEVAVLSAEAVRRKLGITA